jgi:hypothetical protein
MSESPKPEKAQRDNWIVIAVKVVFFLALGLLVLVPLLIGTCVLVMK